MKRIVSLLIVLPVLVAAAIAQESRQDVSASFSGIFPPFVAGNTNVQLTGHNGAGGLLSYRYMLTPSSALEGNFQLTENANLYNTNPTGTGSYPGTYRIHTKMLEYSAAYVYNYNIHRWNPFLEAGVGAYRFTPLASGTSILDVKAKMAIGALFGGGVAYELTPSFDIRAEYRGIYLKSPDFGSTQPNLSTGKYYVLSNPVLGIAYHF